MSSPTPSSDIRAVVFDLDDTLAPSKSAMDAAMSEALAQLLERVDVCIISGGRFEQFEAQALRSFDASPDALRRLHLMPTCGTRYYRWEGRGWNLQYAEDLTDDEKSRTVDVLETGARELGLWEPQPWGAILEDRGSQITFSALGQEAPIEAKRAWDPDGAKKRALAEYGASRLPDLEVRGGGSTSIDVTRKGIDKAYGIAKLLDNLQTTRGSLLFIGDRLDVGGNDYPVLEAGVPSIHVSGWKDTLAVVQRITAWLDDPVGPMPVPTMAPVAVVR